MYSSEHKQVQEMKRKKNSNGFDLPYPIRRRNFVLLGLASFSIAFVSALHGMNEAWAWKVAESLITLNGLVLGFSVLAVTIFTRTSFTQSAYEKMVKEAINKIEDAKKSKVEGKSEAVQERVMLFIQPAVRMKILHGVFQLSLSFLLISVGFSLCLFGVNDTMINTRFEMLFFLVYVGAIAFFIIGTFYTFFGAYRILELGQLSFNEMLELYEKEFEKRKQQKEDKSAV